jgi:DNA helicase-2/ATP-dependent DNA helicase PcrA
MDYLDFVSKQKSFVVAPAGYGKTHAIAICLSHTQGKQLVLTHTHAGVASLKDKIQSQEISNTSYRVETITSFAQKYVNAFYCGNDIPDQEESKDYYPFIINKAKDLFKIPAIQDVIKTTYSGLFVDEYQDCNIGQHNLIKELACILPTRILGDHLQGIFDFNGDVLVDFDTNLSDFEKFPDLTEPWRWKTNNPELGNSLKSIRELLEQTQSIDLSQHESKISIFYVDENDKYTYQSEYNKQIWSLTNEDNVLVIHPDSTNLNVRKDFISRFNNSFILVEALDSKDFYEMSKKIDGVNANNFFNTIYNIIPKIFNGRTNRDVWFNSNGAKNKRTKEDRVRIAPVVESIEKLKQKISFSLISDIFKKVKELPGIKCYRQELLWDLCDALEHAESNSASVYEEMKEIRNRKRRGGRRISGRCIGTTLLTKGLEFETVAVLDAHNFKCRKNFYVAITRACKKLIIFTNSKIVSPYSS